MIRTRSTRTVSFPIEPGTVNEEVHQLALQVRMFESIPPCSVSKEPIGNGATERSSSLSWVKRVVLITRELISFFLIVADCAKMIDIDHETKSAFSENLSIPGEEAILLEPNMDQIESKLQDPNLTGTVSSVFILIGYHSFLPFSLSGCG